MQISGILRKQQIPFIQVSTKLLNDRMSAKAKGVYCFIASKHEGWGFSCEKISKSFTDGVKSIEGAVRELENLGWLRRQKLTDGTMEYVLYWENNSDDDDENLDDDDDDGDQNIEYNNQSSLTLELETDPNSPKPMIKSPNRQNGGLEDRVKHKVGTPICQKGGLEDRENNSSKHKGKSPNRQKGGLHIYNNIYNNNNINNNINNINKENNLINNNIYNITISKFNNIILSEFEFSNLLERYGEQLLIKKIDDLSAYLIGSRKKYKSHYLTLNNWIKKDINSGRDSILSHQGAEIQSQNVLSLSTFDQKIIDLSQHAYEVIKKYSVVVDGTTKDCANLIQKITDAYQDQNPVEILEKIIVKMIETKISLYYSIANPRKICENLGTIMTKIKINVVEASKPTSVKIVNGKVVLL